MKDKAIKPGREIHVGPDSIVAGTAFISGLSGNCGRESISKLIARENLRPESRAEVETRSRPLDDARGLCPLPNEATSRAEFSTCPAPPNSRETGLRAQRGHPISMMQRNPISRHWLRSQNNPSLPFADDQRNVRSR